jgi:hypothetical protein
MRNSVTDSEKLRDLMVSDNSVQCEIINIIAALICSRFVAQSQWRSFHAWPDRVGFTCFFSPHFFIVTFFSFSFYTVGLRGLRALRHVESFWVFELPFLPMQCILSYTCFTQSKGLLRYCIIVPLGRPARLWTPER